MTHQTPPILFLVFGRPSTTKIVFEEIRKAKPRRLFIAADAARKDRIGEKERCQATREVVSNVDWDCEVKTLFRDQHLGCGRAVSEAITWFFDHVEEGIILEDDTKPSPEFFDFCAEMLAHYRNDTRVMHIAGTSYSNRFTSDSPYSYFFSDWGDYVWGWATWKRAWKHFDYSMTCFPEVMEKGLLTSNYTSIYERYYMEVMLNRSYYENDGVTWWSVQWGFARKINSGLVAVPTRNMVINLGFDDEATNTTDGSQWNEMKYEKMQFPLNHPQFMMRDRAIDEEVFLKYSTTPLTRLKGKIKYITPTWFYDFFKNVARRYLSLFLIDEYIPTVISYCSI
ncbi:MAG TPA: hypothetical protein VK589_21045 [Chryseolinea sp.]|nr:hypothetical protein [Chryseolinea sp.]